MMRLDPKTTITERQAATLDRAAHQLANRQAGLASANRNIALRQPQNAAWVVLRVVTGKEVTVEKALSDADVETFLPVREGRKTFRRGQPVKVPMRPVMPGYLLVWMVVTANSCIAISRVEHVIGMIGGFENPLKISDGSIAQFRKSLSEREREEPPQTWVEDGIAVRITGGPFVGYEGYLTAFHKHANGRVKMERGPNVLVVFSVGGSSAEIEMPLAFVSKK